MKISALILAILFCGQVFAAEITGTIRNDNKADTVPAIPSAETKREPERDKAREIMELQKLLAEQTLQRLDLEKMRISGNLERLLKQIADYDAKKQAKPEAKSGPHGYEMPYGENR